MIRHSKSKRIALASALVGLGASIAIAQSPATSASIDGRWDAVLTSHGQDIAFRLDISGSGSTLKGTFYNGFEPYDSTTSASFQDGKLVLNLDQYLASITATLNDGELDGNEGSTGRGGGSQYGFHATRHVDTPEATDAPNIAGSWILPLPQASAKGEKAFHLIIDQRGAEVSATILRVDGDTGAYTGTYKDGKWVLSHFDGSRPGVLELSLASDGTLKVIQGSRRPAGAGRNRVAAGGDAATSVASAPVAAKPAAPAASTQDQEYTTAVVETTGPDSRYTPDLVAYREDVAVAKGLPMPENYQTHTRPNSANEKLTFNFPDANGKLVSQDDPRFKGKVVLAIVTGTWCPNCHDEAQYLVKLDKKYRDKGVAIVALDFEEKGQLDSLARLRAFVKHYGVKYTYLVAGDPSEMWEKVPQLTNLNTWPATIFVGRDGVIRGVHSGFASPASGEYNDELKQEFESQIQQLLSEKPDSTTADSATGATRNSGE